MSFVGTLICCGIGGLACKYGNQQFKPLAPPNEVGIQDYTVKFVEKQIRLVKKRLLSASKSFIPGLSVTGLYVYPFISYWEILTSLEYAKYATPIFFAYLALFSLITFVYMLTITPVYMPLSIVLGPIGVVLIWFHTLLHANMLTMMTMRMTQVASYLILPAMKQRDMQIGDSTGSLTAESPVKYYYPMNSAYFFLNHVPWKLFEYISGFSVLCILLLISSIPILGPFFFHILVSPMITRIYWAPYLKYFGFDNLQRESRFYRLFGQYTAFGLVAAFMETWPVFAGIAYPAHTLAICQWTSDLPVSTAPLSASTSF